MAIEPESLSSLDLSSLKKSPEFSTKQILHPKVLLPSLYAKNHHSVKAAESNYVYEIANPPTPPNEASKEQVSKDDRTKSIRHPRWSREETFILIHGKKVIESQTQRGHRFIETPGSDQIGSKWESVSSYCRQFGVRRGPVQCQKKWSNLIGEFKRIKTWELRMKEKAESFWTMRNELRREQKLPSSFDKELYDALNGNVVPIPAIPLTLITVTSTDPNIGNRGDIAAAEEEEELENEGAAAVLYSGQRLAREDGLFGNLEQSGLEEIIHSPKKETISEAKSTPVSVSGTVKDKYEASNTWMGSMSEHGPKRRCLSSDQCEDTDFGNGLTRVLEMNTNMLNTQLEAHNLNCKLDRDQQKEQNDNFLGALRRLTDAVGRIADKL
ncbi:hypothetical protein HS088_TW19G00602 [Tripterygium wilfordii]|uniref:Myb-like domain-containing protein n=1 Tax=Tripterygium wilfordii TaxID=458696 RepID=A0A7J7CA58_TRIWF|nr:hypothetical protein HS088_TW19G00602 [Tripterygium wilfordii]